MVVAVILALSMADAARAMGVVGSVGYERLEYGSAVSVGSAALVVGIPGDSYHAGKVAVYDARSLVEEARFGATDSERGDGSAARSRRSETGGP